MLEAVLSSETSAYFSETKQWYAAEGCNLKGEF
jgi:hypothetical protein